MKIYLLFVLHIYYIPIIISTCADDFGLNCDTCDVLTCLVFIHYYLFIFKYRVAHQIIYR